jgi:hypothetical protein
MNMEIVLAILKIITAIVCVAALITIPFIPYIVKRGKQREIQRFYDSIKVGDGFMDPYYSNDPFSAQWRVLEVVAKKNDYILYEINWYDKATNEKVSVTKYVPRRESMPVERFMRLTDDYTKTMIFD